MKKNQTPNIRRKYQKLKGIKEENIEESKEETEKPKWGIIGPKKRWKT